MPVAQVVLHRSSSGEQGWGYWEGRDIVYCVFWPHPYPPSSSADIITIPLICVSRLSNYPILDVLILLYICLWMCMCIWCILSIVVYLFTCMRYCVHVMIVAISYCSCRVLVLALWMLLNQIYRHHLSHLTIHPSKGRMAQVMCVCTLYIMWLCVHCVCVCACVHSVYLCVHCACVYFLNVCMQGLWKLT